MRTRATVFGIAALLAVCLESFGSAAGPASLLGEWTVVSMERRGKVVDEINYVGMRWIFTKDSLEVHPGHFTPAGIAGKPPLKCSYALDDSQSPRHFNWTLGEGENKKTVSAIYELKDDALRICFAKGGKERPRGFDTKGTEWALYQFKRVTESDQYDSRQWAKPRALPAKARGRLERVRGDVIAEPDARDVGAAFDDAVDAQPKLLRISARCDGSGRIVFTRDRVHYEHKHWGRPTNVLFDGEPWTNLDRTPAPWRDFGDRLDLTKAWIVKRKGRDLIALESTPDGFDLYLCDSPNGAADYAVTLAIPRRLTASGYPLLSEWHDRCQ